MPDNYPITLLLRQISNEFETEFNAQIKDIGLTASQFEILHFLFETDKEEVNQRDIEEYLCLKNPTVTGLLKRLEEKGFILSVQSERDKRRKNVFLTQKAVNIQKKMDLCHRQMESAAVGRLTSREKERLGNLLWKMSEGRYELCR